jgi:hypothetical protein
MLPTGSFRSRSLRGDGAFRDGERCGSTGVAGLALQDDWWSYRAHSDGCGRVFSGAALCPVTVSLARSLGADLGVDWSCSARLLGGLSRTQRGVRLCLFPAPGSVR